jgi:hypothetical protein
MLQNQMSMKLLKILIRPVWITYLKGLSLKLETMISALQETQYGKLEKT